jgi:hypothetical protein
MNEIIQQKGLRGDAEGGQTEEFKRLIKALREPDSEVWRLDEMDRTANAALALLGKDGDLTSEKVQRRVSDARIRLDLVKSRRAGVEEWRDGIEASLKTLYSAECERWNYKIHWWFERLKEQHIAANLPAWPSERECRKFFGNPEHWPPFFHDFLRCTVVQDETLSWNTGTNKIVGGLTGAIGRLISHEERWLPVLGDGFRQAEPPAASASARAVIKKPAQPTKVKVRVKESCTLPALELKKPNWKSSDRHPWRRLEAGELLEISHKDYHALSRFFDLVDAGADAKAS